MGGAQVRKAPARVLWGSVMTCSQSDPGTAIGARPVVTIAQPSSRETTARATSQIMTAEWFIARTALGPASQEKTAVIRLGGELDVTARTTLAELLAPLSGIRPDRLVIDLDQADFLDCGTAAVIFNAATQALPPGTVPIIRAQGPIIRRLLQLTGLDSQCVMDQPPQPGLSPG